MLAFGEPLGRRFDNSFGFSSRGPPSSRPIEDRPCWLFSSSEVCLLAPQGNEVFCRSLGPEGPCLRLLVKTLTEFVRSSIGQMKRNLVVAQLVLNKPTRAALNLVKAARPIDPGACTLVCKHKYPQPACARPKGLLFRRKSSKPWV